MPVGANPNDVAVNPATNRVYVANGGDNTVSVIDGNTDAVIGDPIPVGGIPSNIAVSPDKNKIYVSNQDDGTVSVIDGATNTVVKTLTYPGGAPGAIDVNPVNGEVYVLTSNASYSGVMIIDGSSNAETDLPLPAAPSDLAVDAKTNTVFAVDGAELVAIDGTTHDVTTHALADQADRAGFSFVAVDEGTNTIVVTGGTAFVSLPLCNGAAVPPPCRGFDSDLGVDDEGQRSVTIRFDGSDFSSTRLQEPVAVPRPAQVVFNPSTNTAFTYSSPGAAKILRFDPVANSYTGQAGTFETRSTFRAPAQDHLLVVNPNTDRVYFTPDLQPANPDIGLPAEPGGVLALDGSTMLPTPGSPLGEGRSFVAVAVNSQTNKIYAVDRDDGNVAVLK